MITSTRNLGDFSAFQYCTGNFQAPKFLGVSETSWDLQGLGQFRGLERQFGQNPRLSGVRKRVVFKNSGFEGCSPGTKTGTRLHPDVPLERQPERGYVRMF